MKFADEIFTNNEMRFSFNFEIVIVLYLLHIVAWFLGYNIHSSSFVTQYLRNCLLRKITFLNFSLCFQMPILIFYSSIITNYINNLFTYSPSFHLEPLILYLHRRSKIKHLSQRYTTFITISMISISLASISHLYSLVFSILCISQDACSRTHTHIYVRALVFLLSSFCFLFATVRTFCKVITCQYQMCRTCITCIP